LSGGHGVEDEQVLDLVAFVSDEQVDQVVASPGRLQAGRRCVMANRDPGGGVVEREVAFNGILATVCAEYARCRWDDKAVYNYQFSASKVSTLDYFHPSLSGQATLASVTWDKSWWASA
jgi:hypothetical protein